MMTTQVAQPDAMKFKRLKDFTHNPLGIIAAVILLLIVLGSIFAPLLSPHDPNFVSLRDSLLPPGGKYPLGTDGNGRDILSRLLWGGRVSLQAGMIMAGTAIVVGVPAGLLAGYYTGWFDAIANYISNILMSLPAILIVIVVIATLGGGLAPTMITFGLLGSPDLFRLTRSAVIGVRQELYIDAARVAGLSDFRVIFRHVLSVVLGPVLVRSSFIFGMAIIAQAGLEFLGFGNPNRPSWGGELDTAFRSFQKAPELVVAPGAAIGVTVMAFVLLGAAIADSLGVAGGRGGKRVKPATQGSTTQVNGAGDPSQSATDSTTQRLLKVENLTIKYPLANGEQVTVVNDVSLTVDRGEVLGIVGESGSGKSQTSFAILGLLPPDASVVAKHLSLDGDSILELSRSEWLKIRGSKIAYVPQEPMSNLDPSFTIGSQLIKPMRRKLGISKREATERALDLINRVGIPDPQRVMASYPHQLSGGMAQRVLIAGAVSCDPELLIADEPTTALDVTIQAEILRLLRDLQQERNMGLILVTHNLGVVADICDRVIVMRKGEVVEDRPLMELFSNPQEDYTRALLDSTLEGTLPRAQRDARAEGVNNA